MAELSWTARVSLGMVSVTFLMLVISHLSPYWYSENPYTHIGLWEKCEWRKPCVWSHENHFYWELIQPTWWIVCQVLYSLALFTVFINLCIVLEINCGTKVSNFKKLVNLFFMLLAFVEMLATVSHFGVMAEAERGVVVGHPDHTYRNFDWAYLLACLATLLQLLNIVFFIMYYIKAKKREGKEDDGFDNPMLNPMLRHPGSQQQMMQPGAQYNQPNMGYQPPPQQYQPQQQQYQPQLQQYQPPAQQYQPPAQQYQPAPQQYQQRGYQPQPGYSQQQEYVQHRQAPY